MISKESILRKTHYGLTIYAHILRSFYPGETVLSLRGRNCQTTRNPYNDGQETLIISIEGDIAKHIDTDGAIENGDVFDFAARFFNLNGQELLDKINTEMHLRIGQPNSFYAQRGSKSNELNSNLSKFSYFKLPVKNTKPFKEVTIYDIYQLIIGKDYFESTITLRAISDLKEARSFKAKYFDYVTFSGTFKTRNDKELIKHSGLMAIDFDHLTDLDNVREQLLMDEYFETELLFVSPSGDGLKWIIPVELEKVSHQEYFRAVANYVRQTYKLEIDQSGKDISRACFLPNDPTAYINPKYLQL